MLPVRLWKLIEGDEPVPIRLQAPRRFEASMVLTPVHKLVASLFRFPPSGRIRDRAQQRFGRALLPLGEFIEDIEDPVIPAPLLLGFRIHVAHGAPDARRR